MEVPPRAHRGLLLALADAVRGHRPEAAGASFERGVLTVRIPKPEQVKPRRVKIGVGDGAPETIEADSSS